MNLQQAINKATKLAEKKQETFYLVWEYGEEGYQVCNDYDLDTFYNGLNPDYAVEPNGAISRGRHD